MEWDDSRYAPLHAGSGRPSSAASLRPGDERASSCMGFTMTNEQIKARAAVRAAFVAAETTGLTEADIWQAAVTGLVHSEVKGGQPPGNYNPISDGLDKPKNKAHHG
jgi:hypothetical protein